MATETKTIDITPTDEGFARIAEMFAMQILADVRKARVEDDRHLLQSLIETVAYLAVANPELVVELRKKVAPVEPIVRIAIVD